MQSTVHGHRFTAHVQAQAGGLDVAACHEAGFTTGLSCSSCGDLDQFALGARVHTHGFFYPLCIDTSLATGFLNEDCKKCCTDDGVAGKAAKIRAPKAVLEVCH